MAALSKANFGAHGYAASFVLSGLVWFAHFPLDLRSTHEFIYFTFFIFLLFLFFHSHINLYVLVLSENL